MRLALILLGGLIVTQASAAELKLLRPGHPRLDMDAAELAALRKDAAAVAAARAAGDGELATIRTGSYRDFFVELPSGTLPKPHPGDSWPYWTGICGQMRSYLETTARAYALSGDPKYLAASKQLALAVAAWPKWTDPDYGSHPCLDTHSLLNGMSRAYDWLYPALSEEERKTLRDAIVEKGLKFVYADGEDEKSYLFQPNAWPNGYAVINASMGIGALALFGEVDGADGWLNRSLDKARLFFDQQGGKDGGLLEGFGYGSFAIDTLVALLQCLHDITGVSLLDNPYLSQAIFFPAYFMVPGGGSLPAIGDNGGPAGCPPTLTGLAKLMLSVRHDPVAAWYLKQAGQSGGEIERLARPPDDLPLGRHFRDIDWAALRSGWGPNDALMAFKCGQTKSHNHLDQNSLVLAWGAEWLLNDPGYQIYDIAYPAERNLTKEVIHNRHVYTEGTAGHNALLVDGAGQSTTPGTIPDFFTSAAMTYVAGDASGPYQETLKVFTRHIVSLPGGDYLIYDQVETTGAARAIETLFHTTKDGVFLTDAGEVPRDKPLPADQVIIRRSAGEVRLASFAPTPVTMTHKLWPDCDEYGHYLSLASPEKTVLAPRLFVLRPGPREKTPPIEAEVSAIAEDHAAFVNRHDDGTDRVILNLTTAPVGLGDFAVDGICGVLTERRGHTNAALYHGLLLRSGNKTWLACSRAADVGAAFDGTSLRIDLVASEPTDFTIACPINPQLVDLHGVESPIQFEYNTAARELRLKGVKGSLHLIAKALP